MTITINLELACDDCDKITDTEFLFNQICNQCLDKRETIQIRAALHDSINHDYVWDKDSHEGFITKEDESLYLKGVIKGYKSALFWIADYFDEVEEWEKVEKLLIEEWKKHDFYNQRGVKQ